MLINLKTKSFVATNALIVQFPPFNEMGSTETGIQGQAAISASFSVIIPEIKQKLQKMAAVVLGFLRIRFQWV